VSRPLLVGEVAAAAGVSADTIRHYERKGVLAPAARSASGYRRYPPDVVARVALVRRALRIGFSLDELARVLRDRDRGGAPCREVRALVGARLADLERHIAELARLRRELRALLARWDETLRRTPPGRQARLLEAPSLADRPAPRPAARSGRRRLSGRPR